jgi:hypothetical protein
MKFSDTSMIALLAEEPARKSLLAVLDDDPQVVAWWGTSIEIASALARREGEQLIGAADFEAAMAATHLLAEGWHEILPPGAVRRTAERLPRAHPLRAAVSLPLAAALMAADQDPTTLELVCLDTRLTAATRREGFKVQDA